MQFKALLFITLTPFIYLYGLAENHFSFGKTVRGYTYDFLLEYVNAWRILFGGKVKDTSVKVAEYDFKVKARKSKFDVDIALHAKKLFGSWNIRFDKKTSSMSYFYQSGYSDENFKITKVGKDKFLFEWGKFGGWKSRHIGSEYQLNKEQILTILSDIKTIK